MKSIKEFFGRGQSVEKEHSLLEAEAKQFRTPSEWLPQTLKFIFFVGLAFLNYRLFSKTVPGLWGHATGVVAIMAEAIALYSTHNFSRSSGWFRLALGVSGSVLMVFAISHSTFSFLDLVNVLEVSDMLHWYARVVAFPLLASLLGLSVLVITMTHPKNRVRLEQAKAHTEVMTTRAQTASELELIRARSIVDNAQLSHQREKTRREQEFLVELNQMIETEKKKIAMVAAITDPGLRDAMARELGIDPRSLAQRELDSETERPNALRH